MVKPPKCGKEYLKGGNLLLNYSICLLTIKVYMELKRQIVLNAAKTEGGQCYAKRKQCKLTCPSSK
jgi:hypothetical protein